MRLGPQKGFVHKDAIDICLLWVTLAGEQGSGRLQGSRNQGEVPQSPTQAGSEQALCGHREEEEVSFLDCF